MDIVYILGKGSCWGDNEIRFSLRSVEKNVLDVGNVFIVGECPDWLKNITHIPAEDFSSRKWRNAFHKIGVACRDSRVSEDFLLMNDDFFIMQNVRILDYPFYHSGKLPSFRLAPFRGVSFKRKDFLNYGVHRPFRYNKAKFLAIEKIINKALDCPVRSFYGNYYNIGGKFCRDPIITPGRSEKEIENAFVGYTDFSITTATARSNAFRRWIKNSFPTPSRFEKKSEH